jgi:DNA-binding MarR family transcriptional regulator
MADTNATGPQPGHRPPGDNRAGDLVAWHYLLQVSTRVIRELERRFDLEHRISAREFDVLINLEHAPGRRLRMTELATTTMLSSGGLTRLVGRLEERGLLQRDLDPADARAYHARLTDRGRTRLAAMRATHDAIVHELFGAHLSAVEVEALRTTLARVLGPDLRT